MFRTRKIIIALLFLALTGAWLVGVGPSGILLDPLTPAWGAGPTTTIKKPVATTTTTAPPSTTSTTVPLAPLPVMNAVEAKAMAMVTYPWRKIPNYTIVFEPYSKTPVAGVYGMTTFIWGQPGGKTTIFVKPTQTAQDIAGIIAFEIGHQVDAAGVYPAGGHAAIKKILKIYPKSWSPVGLSSERGYLSGWYCAAFANRWSKAGFNPHWSTLAPAPTGAVSTAMEKWLNPTIVPAPPPITNDL